MQPQHPQLAELHRALSDLTTTIRALPEEQQLEAFLKACSALLNAMSATHVAHVRDLLQAQFPDLRDDNEVVDLIEGHLPLRELTERSSRSVEFRPAGEAQPLLF